MSRAKRRRRYGQSGEAARESDAGARALQRLYWDRVDREQRQKRKRRAGVDTYAKNR